MKARQLDERSRLVVPLPPHSAVTLQRLDESTWLLRHQQPLRGLKMVLIPVVEHLPHDPKEEAIEKKLARHFFRKLPRPQDDE